MIKIKRPKAPPLCLTTRGVDQTKKDCDDYDACADEYRRGRKVFTIFDRNIYADASVKATLLDVHNGKCCYCEKKYIPANLHIEHFRPKKGVRQRRNQSDIRPGYFWLAYAWKNLLLACHQCNSVYKKTLFPLANPRIRTRAAMSHHYDIKKEEPLFIDPSSTDPRKHIRFRGASPVALSQLGRTTIREIGLRNSPIVKEGRISRLNYLETFVEIIEAHKSDPANTKLRKLAVKARRVLTAATRPEAEYSSMAQDYLKDRRP